MMSASVRCFVLADDRWSGEAMERMLSSYGAEAMERRRWSGGEGAEGDRVQGDGVHGDGAEAVAEAAMQVCWRRRGDQRAKASAPC